mgnify:CR=1 FL=1
MTHGVGKRSAMNQAQRCRELSQWAKSIGCSLHLELAVNIAWKDLIVHSVQKFRRWENKTCWSFKGKVRSDWNLLSKNQIARKRTRKQGGFTKSKRREWSIDYVKKPSNEHEGGLS